MEGNSIHNKFTLLQLPEEARATRKQDVLAWIPPFASLSVST